MRIHFVRHAEANYDLEQVPGEFPGVPLTDLGHKQAHRTSEKIRNFKYDHIFCSDMRRTKETIKPCLKHWTKRPIYDLRLREISDAVTSNHNNNWFSEPKSSQIQRMKSFLNTLKSLNGEILIVAHFGVIKYLSKQLRKEIESPEYAGHYVLEL